MERDLYFDYVYLHPRDAERLRINFLGQLSTDRDITFYVDNSKCMDSLVWGYTEALATSRIVKLIWPQVERLGIAAWFGIIPSGFSPGRRPDRGRSAPAPR